jgi:hypothetical protein
MPGLLKVGYTTRSVDERISELSSTGVPKRFQLEFCMEVQEPAIIETMLHKKLSSKKFGKEFFKTEISDVVEICKVSIMDGLIQCHTFYGKSSRSFLTAQEKEDAEKARLKRIKDTEDAKEKERKRIAEERKKYDEFQNLKSQLWNEYRFYGCELNKILAKHSTSVGPMRTALGLGLALTGVGFLLMDHVLPPSFDDGFKSAKKLNADEIFIAKSFYATHLKASEHEITTNRWTNSLAEEFSLLIQEELGKENYLIDSKYRSLSLLTNGFLAGLGILKIPKS